MFSRVFVPPDCFAESPPPSSITGTSCPSFSLLACPFLKSSLWHFRHKLTASPEPQEPPVLISTSAPNSASGIAGGISSGPEEPGRMNCLMVRVPRWSSGFLISFFSSPLPSPPSPPPTTESDDFCCCFACGRSKRRQHGDHRRPSRARGRRAASGR